MAKHVGCSIITVGKALFFFFQYIIVLIMHLLFSLNLKYVVGRNLRAHNNGHLKGICMGFFCMTTRLCLRQCIYSHKSDVSGKDQRMNNCMKILE